jgi:hypothetical protein
VSEDLGPDLPHDIGAERKVLSAMLNGAGAIEQAGEMLVPEDFYRPGHRAAFRAMVVMHAAGETAAVETVRDWIAADGALASLGGPRAGEYLFDLDHLGIPWVQVSAFARIVSDLAVRRRWTEAGTRIIQMASEPGDTGEMSGLAATEAARAEALAGEYARGPRLLSPSQLAGAAGAKPEPVIPEFLNRMDRIVTVGAGGSGKTVMAYQVAAAAAVGRHPFLAETFEPVRVLAIDLEMPTYLLNENLALVFGIARYYGDPEAGGRFQVFHQPRGLNLLKPGNAQILTGLIRKHRPDLIVGGPAYKMHGDTGERGDHTGVMDYWDEIRDRFGCALWLETHPAKKPRFGKQDWSPAGSGRWADWPEIGFALVPGNGDREFDAVPFRGSRDARRPWPEKFTQSISGGWPWQATWPTGALGGMT